MPGDKFPITTGIDELYQAQGYPRWPAWTSPAGSEKNRQRNPLL